MKLHCDIILATDKIATIFWQNKTQIWKKYDWKNQTKQLHKLVEVTKLFDQIQNLDRVEGNGYILLYTCERAMEIAE